MFKKIIRGLENYFFGRDIVEYYKKIEKEFPEHRQRIEEDKKEDLINGKIIPNIIDVSSLVLGYYSNFLFSAAIIGITETLRHGYNESFKLKKENYKSGLNKEYENLTLDKIIQNSSNKK